MRSKYTLIAAIIVIVLLAGLVVYPSIPNLTGTAIMINASGASFPYPLFDGMITQYQNVQPHVQINYQPSGSGAGISALKNKTVEFAASDVPLSTSETDDTPQVLHIPETIGAITIVYNINGVSSGLKLTGQVIADIFQGKITTWNDAAITSLNPNIALPAANINTVYRSEGSGTTYVFTGYLSAASSSWHSNIGQGKSVSWPVGSGSRGNVGVTSFVKSTTNSIGYVELTSALQGEMTVAAIQNPLGNFVMPTLESIATAAQVIASSGLPAGNECWSNVTLLNAKDPDAYPIVTFSYILVYKELNNIPNMTQERATALVQFFWYVIHDGQELASDLYYVALPSNVVELNVATIQSITFNGQTLQTSTGE
ncbi:MAG: phosphate ABC transporter substrate-binding protein PstS [Candidatus Bathyarchaeota archaeon]|nr:phosphate ABC transporter substrate-binding protein PstS [Candidatus Termiticorpusculum sp.]